MKTVMKTFYYLALLSAFIVAAACGKDSPEPACSIAIPIDARMYEFGHRGTGQTFLAWTTNAGVIANVEAQLALPEEERTAHINGEILEQPKNCELNPGWSWYFNPQDWDMTEISIELCDGNPQYVEDNLQDYLHIERYCPWSSYVLREINQPE